MLPIVFGVAAALYGVNALRSPYSAAKTMTILAPVVTVILAREALRLLAERPRPLSARTERDRGAHRSARLGGVFGSRGAARRARRPAGARRRTVRTARPDRAARRRCSSAPTISSTGSSAERTSRRRRRRCTRPRSFRCGSARPIRTHGCARCAAPLDAQPVRRGRARVRFRLDPRVGAQSLHVRDPAAVGLPEHAAEQLAPRHRRTLVRAMAAHRPDARAPDADRGRQSGRDPRLPRRLRCV